MSTKVNLLTEEELDTAFVLDDYSYLEPLQGAPKKVEEYLNTISYDYSGYHPSPFALEFMAFVNLVRGENKQENQTPIFHYKMLDSYGSESDSVANLVFRGGAKSSLLVYLILYLATYRKLPGYPHEIEFMMYVSDTIENGVKTMRGELENAYYNSDFLLKVLPKCHFIEREWRFTNANGKEFSCQAFGIMTGIRGKLRFGRRPQIACLDDLISDKDARSESVIDLVNEVIHSGLENALHPQNKIIWNGTPFHEADPLYLAVESGSWDVNVYPACEEFPVSKENFKPAWGDRFTYKVLLRRYLKARAVGKASSFQQEMMLRITSEADRLVNDRDIMWFHRSTILKDIQKYNVYITTDFATSAKSSADFSVINVWLHSATGDWLWIDGVCQQVLMDQTMKDLFRLVAKYRPMEVGIEVSGQQGGFLAWIKQTMIQKNVYFNVNEINPTSKGNKEQRFIANSVPLFKTHKIWLPEELRNSRELEEMRNELRLATRKGFKSKHDDQLDTITMLSALEAYRPASDNNAVIIENEEVVEYDAHPFHNGLGGLKKSSGSSLDSYTVN